MPEEEDYTYEIEVKDGKVIYHKIPVDKSLVKSKVASKPQYTTEGRRRYNDYVKKSLGKGISVIPMDKWLSINFPKGMVK